MRWWTMFQFVRSEMFPGQQIVMATVGYDNVPVAVFGEYLPDDQDIPSEVFAQLNAKCDAVMRG